MQGASAGRAKRLPVFGARFILKILEHPFLNVQSLEAR